MVENYPEQGDLFIDNDKQSVTISTPGGPVELSLPAGTHDVLVKKGEESLLVEQIAIRTGARTSKSSVPGRRRRALAAWLPLQPGTP